MNENDFSIFNKLSIELINKIINYTDVIVLRNGVYMDRISKMDKRYLLLEKIPRPIKILNGLNNYLVCIRIFNYNVTTPYGYILTYGITNNTTLYLSVNFCYKIIDGFDRYIKPKTKDKYIFDSNSVWRKVVYYQM